MDNEQTEKVIIELSATCRELIGHIRQQEAAQQELLCWLAALTLHAQDKQKVLLSFEMVSKGIPEKNWTHVRQTLLQAVQSAEQSAATSRPIPPSLRIVKDEAP